MSESTYTVAMRPEMKKALKKAAELLSDPIVMRRVTPAEIVRSAVAQRLNEIFEKYGVEKDAAPEKPRGIRRPPPESAQEDDDSADLPEWPTLAAAEEPRRSVRRIQRENGE